MGLGFNINKMKKTLLIITSTNELARSTLVFIQRPVENLRSLSYIYDVCKEKLNFQVSSKSGQISPKLIVGHNSRNI